MKHGTHHCHAKMFAVALALVALALASLGQASVARADDRDLFGTASTAPYLFVLLDTTGSMQWRPNANDAYCGGSNVGGGPIGLSDPACTDPRIDDSPGSRMYQAKDALYSVLDETVGVSWGFSIFPNQTQMRITDISLDPVDSLPFVGRTSPFADGNAGYEGNACNGLEKNGDEGSDEYSSSYNLLQDDGALTATGLPIGDLIPFDWGNNNRLKIQERLAPNLKSDPGGVPDFGIASYFQTTKSGGVHLLKKSDERPILAKAGTPLAGALQDFKNWFDDWEDIAADPSSPGDPSFADGCREVSTVLVTDGVETCGGNPENAASNLWNPGGNNRKIRTFVIGFATNNPSLDDIAEAGGSEIHDCDGDGTPDAGCYAYRATDKDQLIQAFSQIVGSVRGTSRTFSTAAVPSVIGSAGDNIYLSSFSPINPSEDPTAVWPGRLDAYKKPVPLTDVSGTLVPDSTEACADPDTDKNCLAWRAHEKLLEQAPNAVEVETDLMIGLAANKRRVFYGRDGTPQGRVPENRRNLVLQTVVGQQNFLYGPSGFGFTPVPGASDPDRPNFVSNGDEVIKYFLREKQATIIDPLNLVPISIDYVMGDIFHSDPVVVGDPGRADYFAKDLEGEIEPCGTTNDFKDRYPCFVKNQIGRRRVLLAGSNEGALHAFDAGYAYRNADGFLEYTAGTGQELFAYVPRSVMPQIRDMWENGGQRFTLDGPVVIDDVLRDRDFENSDPLDPDDREWSTVAIGGLREGGRSYYALDVTQPDAIDPATKLPIPDSRGPGCTNQPATCDTQYPESLWEFSDEIDEDNNRTPDLGFTWSKVNTGRIRLIDSGAGLDPDGNPILKDMYVAVFGGGLDPEFKLNPVADPVAGGGLYRYSGNYLYMVDIETGQMVYKRRIDKTNYFGALTTPSMAPSEPAAVDLDQDSYLDTIYIGTTAGYLYKVDISEPVAIEEDVDVEDWLRTSPSTGSRPLVLEMDRITDSKWDPFPIFSTGGRPIYYPPSVIFVPELARFALAFGTGDREDLWNPRYDADALDGRFYVLLDDGLEPDAGDPTALPLDESDLQGFVATDSAAGDSEADLIANPDNGDQGGYYLELTNKERLIAKSFGLSGVLFFSTYIPETIAAGDGESCGSGGKSRLYSVFTTNGVGIRSSKDRYREVDDFVTSPFVEADGGSGDKPSDDTLPPDGSQACADDELQAIRTSLMSKMPAECNFAQYSVNVMTLSSSSGVECIVPIPVCVVQRNWKEF